MRHLLIFLKTDYDFPSEKAFSYKMRLEAMKRQGKRTDLTSSPLDKKSKGTTSAQQLGEQNGDIRMGVVSGTLDGILAKEMVKYARNNNRIRFHITESSSERLMDMVRQEKLDMAIVDSSDRDRSLHFRKLYERDFFVAVPLAHPLADRDFINPKDVVGEPQVVFNYDVGRSFKEWTTGAPTDEAVVCTVDTARAALDLVANGMGIAFVPNECVENRPGIRFIPLHNWHQALYMCILYDKWLDQPVWDFVEIVVKAFRKKNHQ